MPSFPGGMAYAAGKSCGRQEEPGRGVVRATGRRQLHRQVARAVAGLNEKERFIVEKRISADEPMTLQEIATQFSISRERVRQIEEAALKKMKTALAPVMCAA